MKNWWYSNSIMISFGILFSPCFGQNLVDNGDFEKISSCPDNENQLYLAYNWHSPSYASPDLMSECSSQAKVGVPKNFAGFQYAYNGQNYAHILVNNISGNDHEYLSAKLSQALKQNVKYEVIYRITLADFSRYGIDRMGVLFTAHKPYYQTYFRIEEFPQLVSKKGFVLADIANWIEIRDTFLAEGGEQYLRIGQFYPNDSLQFVYFPNPQLYFASYYIDGVEVNEIKEIEEPEKPTAIKVFPNPTYDVLNIESPTGFEYTLYNCAGQVVMKGATADTTIELSLKNYASGVYILHVLGVQSVFVKVVLNK